MVCSTFQIRQRPLRHHRHKLQIAGFPFVVLHRIAEVLLEAEQRGLWNAKAESKAELQKLFLSLEGELEEKQDN